MSDRDDNERMEEIRQERYHYSRHPEDDPSRPDHPDYRSGGGFSESSYVRKSFSAKMLEWGKRYRPPERKG